MDWCSALWRISWALSSSPPGISSWLHPVYHGRGVLVYALCFYRARITVLRIVLANLVVNLLVNALMGSLWNLMLRGGVHWGGSCPAWARTW